MDPVSIMVAAVIAGVSSGVTDAVKDDIKDAYSAFRERLLARFRDSSLVKRSLTDVEHEPTDENKEYLTESLSGRGLTDSDELVALARRVINADGRPVNVILQQQSIAKNATVKRSGVSIEGLSQDSSAKIFQRHDVGENADVEDSPSSINFRDASGR